VGLPAHVDHVEARQDIFEAEPVDYRMTGSVMWGRSALRMGSRAIGAARELRN